MTVQEVNENIRYNQRLVYSYQSQLNNINAQMNSTKQGITDAQAQKKWLIIEKETHEDDYKQLAGLRKQYEMLRDTGIRIESKRVSDLNNFDSMMLGQNMAVEYRNVAHKLVKNSMYESAMEDVYRDINTVNMKMSSLNQMIIDDTNSISKVEQDIRYRTDRLHELQRKRTKISDDLAYRKRRIIYWQNQLRYATR